MASLLPPTTQLWPTIATFALGQLLSILITLTAFTSSQLARAGIDVPTSQSFCNYLLLAVVYGSLLLYRGKGLQVSWYYYFFLALVDVEANYLVVKAYQYTSMTSVMLLDRGSLLFVLLLTWAVLKTKYTVGQLIGVFICVLAVVLLVFSDVNSANRSGGKNLVLGDIMVLIASILYAISNVSEESLIKTRDTWELLAFLGCFGALISASQSLVLERSTLKSIQWSINAVAPFIGFAVSLFSFYTLVPVLLKRSGSTMLNLSLVTSDVWAITIRTFLYHQKVNWLYFVAFTTVLVGLIIYSFFGVTHSNDIQSSKTEDHYHKSSLEPNC